MLMLKLKLVKIKDTYKSAVVSNGTSPSEDD